MIFVTGDTHGDFQRFSRKHFPQRRQMGRDLIFYITFYNAVFYIFTGYRKISKSSLNMIPILAANTLHSLHLILPI